MFIYLHHKQKILRTKQIRNQRTAAPLIDYKQSEATSMPSTRVFYSFLEAPCAAFIPAVFMCTISTRFPRFNQRLFETSLQDKLANSVELYAMKSARGKKRIKPCSALPTQSTLFHDSFEQMFGDFLKNVTKQPSGGFVTIFRKSPNNCLQPIGATSHFACYNVSLMEVYVFCQRMHTCTLMTIVLTRISNIKVCWANFKDDYTVAITVRCLLLVILMKIL